MKSSSANRSIKLRDKKSHAALAFDVVNTVIMCLLLFVFLWPLWFVLIASISDPNEVWLGNVTLLPKGITLAAYQELLKYKNIWIGYRNTIFYTVAGTLVSMVLTVCVAYPLSRKDFMLRNVIMFLLMFTMYFSGGLIPTYLIVSKLGMTNTPWAMIIPGAISTYNVIVARTYFANSIPDSLQEAAKLDGANNLQILLKIIVPLSKPILAVIGLYYAVGYWNEYYNALVYIYDTDLLPLQSFLKDMLINVQRTMGDAYGASATEMEEMVKLAQTLKYSTIIVASIPMLCVYPFIQKFFVKGVMIGSVKG